MTGRRFVVACTLVLVATGAVLIGQMDNPHLGTCRDSNPTGATLTQASTPSP